MNIKRILRNTIIAFINSKGGAIYLSVNDDCKVIGIKLIKKYIGTISYF